MQIENFTYEDSAFRPFTINYNPDGLIGICNIGMTVNDYAGRSFLGECGGSLYGNVDMHQNTLKNLPTPVDDGDAVSKAYLEEKLDEVDLDSYATEEYVNDAIENVKGNIGDFKVIIDVVELPIENVREDCFYRLLSGSLVYSQHVFNTYAVHCVETLPETGLPAINIDQTEGNVYYSVSDDEVYGYVDDILSVGLGVPAGWYSGATLLGALGYEYAGVITNILDDPSDGKFRLLLEYVIYDHKSGNWASHKKIGRAGTGASAETFNHPTNVASGVASHAEGIQTTASGDQSHAEGFHSRAKGENSHAEGYSSHAEGFSSHAEGFSSHAGGTASHSEGDSSYAEGFCSHAEGFYSHAVGRV